ncbi:MAG: DUF1996 domain-containing protein [Actinomycetota bacterium]
MPAPSADNSRFPAWLLPAGVGLIVAVAAFLLFNPGAGDNTALDSTAGPSTTAVPEGAAEQDAAPSAVSVVGAEDTTSVDAESGTDGDGNALDDPTGTPAADDAGTGTGTDDGGDAANGLTAEVAAEPPAADPGQPATTGGGSTDAYEAIRNRQDRFSRYGAVPSDQLDLAALTEAAPRPDNGPSPEGQFRVACEYSHFGSDDPIIFPGQPGASHLHMFFGNTLTNANTTEEQLLNQGGGTCSGFELNRSAYWTPALLDGKGNTVVPDAIILYYKTKFPGEISPMPQGLQMLAGNFDRESFEASDRLHWSCGGSGAAYNMTNRIPDCGGDYINATIQFPSCWDGVNLGAGDFVSHLAFGSDHEPCPASHPVRLPRISILLYFPGVDSVAGWRLSSDDTAGFNSPPGGTLHADWWGAWNDDAMDLWIDGCMRAARNCSFGQTGTSIQLAGVSDRDVYEGNNFLPLP